jgi:serine/threonine-protein kinase RsbW
VTFEQPHEAHLDLASRFENIELAERALLDLCRTAGVPEDDEYWLTTALREAVANAIKHGNQQDPERRVRIVLRVDDHTVSMRIEDQGEGFDPGEVPDPTDESHLLSPSGRGIFYMRQFMTRVDFEQAPHGGTSVVMERSYDASGRSTPDEE